MARDYLRCDPKTQLFYDYYQTLFNYSALPTQLSDQGLLRSQICRVHADAIVWGIKKVWSELFTAKSIFYWQKLQISIISR